MQTIYQALCRIHNRSYHNRKCKVFIISTAQNDVIDIQLGRAHVSKIFPENNSVPLVPDIKVGANATRLALIDAVIMRGCNRPAVFYCIVVDIALCKCILNTKNLLCFCQYTKIGDSSFPASSNWL